MIILSTQLQQKKAIAVTTVSPVFFSPDGPFPQDYKYDKTIIPPKQNFLSFVPESVQLPGVKQKESPVYITQGLAEISRSDVVQ